MLHKNLILSLALLTTGLARPPLPWWWDSRPHNLLVPGATPKRPVVEWVYEPRAQVQDAPLGDTVSVRDVLEWAESPEGPWQDIAGPYTLNPARTHYQIFVDPSKPSAVFRVRRELGQPWTN